MEKSEKRMLTAGRIADAVGTDLHRVLYILRTRAHIRPAARAGTLRLYRADAVAMVRHELNSLDARRSKGVSRG